MYCYKSSTGSWQFYHLVEIIIDNEDIFEGNLELIKQAGLDYEIEIGKATFDEVKDKLAELEL